MIRSGTHRALSKHAYVTRRYDRAGPVPFYRNSRAHLHVRQCAPAIVPAGTARRQSLCDARVRKHELAFHRAIECRCEGAARQCDSLSGANATVSGHRNRHGGYERVMEGERSSGWKRGGRNNFIERHLHGAGGAAIARECDDHGCKQCGLDGERVGRR